MLYWLKIYALTFPAFLAIDAIWLGLVARKFYTQKIGHLMTDQPNWIAAFVFYALFVAAVLLFCVKPALDKDTLWLALALGGAFGLVTYGTYDLTNLATLRQWPLLVTFVDMVWGMVLSGSVATIGYAIGKWLQ